MDKKQALSILGQAIAQMETNFANHMAMQQALRTLSGPEAQPAEKPKVLKDSLKEKFGDKK